MAENNPTPRGIRGDLLEDMHSDLRQLATELLATDDKETADVYAQLDETVERLGLRREYIKQRRAAKREAMQRWEAMFL